MKRIVSLLLVGAFLTLSPDLPPQPPARAQGLGPALLLVAVFAVGATIVFYVWKTNTAQQMRWLVLNDDDLAGHLTPVLTNHAFVGPNLTMALPVFRVYTDSHEPQGFWRVTELTVAPTNWVPNVIRSVNGHVVQAL